MKDVPSEIELRSFVQMEIPRVKEELRKSSGGEPSGLWAFLNSAFGLFFLSSVVLSALAALYSSQLQAVAKDQESYREIMKYATEFNYRLRKLEFQQNAMRWRFHDNRPSLAMIEIIKGEEESVDAMTKFQPSVPEFKNIHLVAIVARLKALGITEKSDDASKALLAIENAWTQEYGIAPEVVDASMSDLRVYRDKGLAEALFKYRKQGWVQHSLRLLEH